MHATLKQESSPKFTLENKKFLNVHVENQTLGIPTLAIQDVLQGLKIVPVPLAPAHVAGLLNLRGRIVVAIDVRASIGLPPLNNSHRKTYNVIVSHKDEFFSLLVDSVGEITEILPEQIEKNPDNLTQRWKAISHGIYKFKDKLLIIANIQKLIGL
jgi:purine-binding chemotaxis protein CheW